MDRRTFLGATGATTLTTLTGCIATGHTHPRLPHDDRDWTDYHTDWTAPTTEPTTSIDVETVATGLEIPWDIGFAPNGDLFITERIGRIRRLSGTTLDTIIEPQSLIDADATPATPDDTPFWESWFLPGGEGGLLGITADPRYPHPPWVYAYLTARTDDGTENRVVRYNTVAKNPGATATPIVTGIPADTIHNGGRLAWGPNNYLWITTGDAGHADRAQNPRSLAGKILRVTADGSPANDNPTRPGWDPRIFTIGHRNPQGLTWLPNGAPIITEHGPDGNDECNRLVAGQNYGWPNARTPTEYDATTYHPPLLSTGDPPAWAPSGATFYTGDAIPSWRHRLLIGELFGQRLGIATITPTTQTPPPGNRSFDTDWLHPEYTVTVTQYDPGIGRIRGVFESPGGDLYALTSNRDGRVKGEAFPTRRDDRLVKFMTR